MCTSIQTPSGRHAHLQTRDNIYGGVNKSNNVVFVQLSLKFSRKFEKEMPITVPVLSETGRILGSWVRISLGARILLLRFLPSPLQADILWTTDSRWRISTKCLHDLHRCQRLLIIGIGQNVWSVKNEEEKGIRANNENGTGMTHTFREKSCTILRIN
jgi:hypothetical protein